MKKPEIKQTFSLLTNYPAQEVSYNNLPGQIRESGNTDLVKYYIELFESAFLMKSIFKYAPKALVRRSSSLKILLLCGALIDRSLLKTREGYGRAVESTEESIEKFLLNPRKYISKITT